HLSGERCYHSGRLGKGLLFVPENASPVDPAACDPDMDGTGDRADVAPGAASNPVRDLLVALRTDPDLVWDLEARRAWESARVSIVPSGFYYPVPTLVDIEESFEYREARPFLDATLFDQADLAANLEALQPFS